MRPKREELIQVLTTSRPLTSGGPHHTLGGNRIHTSFWTNVANQQLLWREKTFVTPGFEGSISIPISTEHATGFLQKICQNFLSINRVNEVNCASNQSFLHFSRASSAERKRKLGSATAGLTDDTGQKIERAFLSGSSMRLLIAQDLSSLGCRLL